MKYSKEQALEIAVRNAIKGISEGYTAEQDKDDSTRWTVTKPDGTTYTLHLHINPTDRTEYRGFCPCKFSGQGYENHTCKHIEMCRQVSDMEYYREIDHEIRETFQQILREDPELIVTTTNRIYHKPLASSLRVSIDIENGEEEQTFTFSFTQKTNHFGDAGIAKAYATDDRAV